MAPSAPVSASSSPSQYPIRSPEIFVSARYIVSHNDNYILVDGDKHAYVKPTYGVKQGCPLSPLLFSIYLNDINEVSEGLEGARTSTTNFHVSNLLYADDLCLTSGHA
eukprot:1160683-Pelagomonas_calceolata.AAC.9